jgi:hypothetical protein
MSRPAHFQVIVRASRATSMTLRFGLILVPPLPTPRAELSMTSTPRIPDLRSDTQTTFSGPHSSMSWRVSVCMRNLPRDVAPVRALAPVRP